MTPSHFSSIAKDYNDLRTTDLEPVIYIRDALSGREYTNAADIGCGTGQYDITLLEAIPRMRLICVDENEEMLDIAKSHLDTNDRFKAVCMDAANFFAYTWALCFDAIFTFNAIHHIGFQKFMRISRPVLGPGGHIFIYTRTRSQNAGSVWGRYFPGFSEKETRLYEMDEMSQWVKNESGFILSEAKEFCHQRVASIERLLHLVHSRHYSTFALYREEELKRAIVCFEENLRREHEDTERIEWKDGNVMIHLRRK